MAFGGMTFGLREGVIALIVLVAAYMLFVLLRMRSLRATTRETAKLAEPQAERDGDRLDTYDQDDAPVTLSARPDELGGNVLMQGLEREVAQLRDEVDAVRGELAALRQDMQTELAHMRATQTVSPIYGDAMQMAVAGYDAAMIAERCGIARAEAELVTALAKSQEQR